MSEPAAPPPDPPSPAATRRRRALLVGVPLALLLVAAAVYVGLRAAGPDQTGEPASRPTPTATPLASLDLSGLPVARRSLCGRIDRGDVERALRGPVVETDHYGSGDRTSLTTGVRDVSHEYDCTYRAGTGAEARVWVFAEPVTRGVARGIVRDVRGTRGCRPVSGGPAYGAPTVSTSCPVATPPGRAVTLRGLFGDAWLSCQVSTPSTATAGDPRRETERRAQRWCVSVATSVGARP